MNVYKLGSDSDSGWVRFFSKSGRAVPLNWDEEPEFFADEISIPIDRNTESTPYGSDTRLADFTNLDYSTYPIFGDRAKQVFAPHLEGLGQWVELLCEEAPYWLFRLTHVVHALDEERSEFARFRDGRVMAVDSFVFRPEALQGQWMFCLPQSNNTPYVTQPFVDLIREHRLTGFKLLRLWSSEAGATNLKVKDWLKPRITGLEGL